MTTVTTTYLFITDAQATDRSFKSSWSRPPVTSSSPHPWKWVTPKSK